MPGPVPALARAAPHEERKKEAPWKQAWQAISMFERNEFGGKRSGGPENDPMTHRLNAGDKHAACCQGGKNGIGEDISEQDMKKNMRWERIEDAEGMRSRADLNCDRWIQSPEC